MYKKEHRSWLKHLDFTLIDIFCGQLALIIAYAIRIGDGLPYQNDWYEQLAIVMVMIQICVVFFMEPYKDILRRDKIQEIRPVIIEATLLFLGTIVFVYSTKAGEAYSRIVLYITWLSNIPIMYGSHVVWKKAVRKHVREEKNRSIMVLVTRNADVEECIRNFEKDLYRSFIIKGIVITDQDRMGDVIREVPVVANWDNFMDYIRMNVVDEVFINGNDISASENLANQLLEMGVTVHFKLLHQSKIMTSKEIESCGGYLVLTSTMKIASPRQLFFKRTMDILGSILGLIITGIAFIIYTPIIKAQSPGPVFFKQIRVGKNGRKFKLYKFRSMYVDAEERKAELMKQNKMDGHMFKLDDDPRVFPIGRFMRKYSIDELPQFWNVLKGDMSLVGTRPPTVDEFTQYEAHHRARLGIKPGITGMWQVSGRSKITDFEQVVALDTEYISRWSIGMDLRILFKTIKVVFKGDGAQ